MKLEASLARNSAARAISSGAVVLETCLPAHAGSP
jgi:hypothetical protein